MSCCHKWTDPKTSTKEWLCRFSYGNKLCENKNDNTTQHRNTRHNPTLNSTTKSKLKTTCARRQQPSDNTVHSTEATCKLCVSPCQRHRKNKQTNKQYKTGH